jgi:hypothetical protein
MRSRVLLSLFVFGLSVQPTVAAESTTFSVESLTGCYVASTYGTVLPDPSNPAVQLPISTLIRFCADAAGNAPSLVTQNIGGACIIGQWGSATYTVDPGGRGIVTANMQNLVASPGCAFLAPPPAVGDKSTFEIRFGIQGDGCLQVIGTALVPEGGAPIPIVIQGQACPQ